MTRIIRQKLHFSNINYGSFRVLSNTDLREKCPYSEFFCYVFSRIRTEYGDILMKFVAFIYSLCYVI